MMLQMLMGGAAPREFKIVVNRNDVVRDAITQLSHQYLEDPTIFVKVNIFKSTCLVGRARPAV